MALNLRSIGAATALLGVGIMLGGALSRIYSVEPVEHGEGGSSVVASSQPSGERALQEVLALRRDLARLESVVADLRRTAGGMRPPESPHADASGRLGATDSEAPLAERGVPDATAAIAEGFRAETPDSEWADKTTALIEGVFAKPVAAGASDAKAAVRESLAGVAVTDVECRATLCRMELAMADPQAVANFMGAFPGRVGRDLPRMVVQPVQTAGGGLGMVVYLARQGHRFPQPQ